MRLALFADLTKSVVTKADITKKVMGDYKNKRNVTNEVIAESQRRFQHIFGFEWRELPKMTIQNRGGIKKRTVGTFIVSDRKSTRLNSSHRNTSRMPSSA